MFVYKCHLAQRIVIKLKGSLVLVKVMVSPKGLNYLVYANSTDLSHDSSA